MPDPILELRGVTKTFGGLTAVDDVSFAVTRGEVFGVAGPNGSGKSTLFNCITGIPFGPTGGEIHFDGTRIDGRRPHAIFRAGLSRTFQKDAEFPDLTARETAALGGHYGGGLRGAELRDAAEEALDLVEFDVVRRDMRTADVSVYGKKQLMIASALASKPSVLMLDEPASGLTRPEIAALDRLLLQVNRTGVTILIIEHVLGLLLSVSQRLLVLNQGSVLTEGDPQEVIRDPRVVEAYLGGAAA
ncbi:ABC transporter ATP-binding protein [Salipiger marinus]|uniref:Branched-chain amino acid transport system ATP-binding protein n=1 Tax=Salipiger marinus TaxID=555512 RepID=A0A1G8UIC0_9RHOB|nr:ABC transporter ATP-binding protein [Salipiger marinus]SDJ53489.1 branched-chain amino acid transport system ATP-binding protein [Salipiger marinus]